MFIYYLGHESLA